MKENTFCSVFCVGILCVISCTDSTFYNRDLHAVKNGQTKNKHRQNTAVPHTSKSQMDPFYQDPQRDPLYRDYFRILEREFIGRGTHPIPDGQEVQKQVGKENAGKKVMGTPLRKNGPFSVNKSKMTNAHAPRRPPFRNNFAPSLVKNPIKFSHRRKPPRRYNKNRENYKRNNYYGRHHWVPERLGRRPMANCNFQNDVDVAQLFPGLFRSETDVMKQPDMIMSQGKKRPEMKIKDLPKVLWCPEKVKEEGNQQQRTSQSQQQMVQPPEFAAAKVQKNIVESVDPVFNGGPRLAHEFPCDPGCCKHATGYAPITQVSINNVTYTAVNTTLLNQYLPVGVCPDTNRCGDGMCIQHQLTHWVLIWNNSLPYWPPLQFTRIELPGYCTWENVHVPGRPHRPWQGARP